MSIAKSTKAPHFISTCSQAYYSHFTALIYRRFPTIYITFIDSANAFIQCDLQMKEIKTDLYSHVWSFHMCRDFCSLHRSYEPRHIYGVYLRQPASSRARIPKAKNNQAQWRTLYWEKDMISHVVCWKWTWLVCVDRCVCEPTAPNQFNLCLPYVIHLLLMVLGTIWLADTHR